MRPCRNNVVEQAHDRLPQIGGRIGTRRSSPPAIAPLRDQEHAELGQKPDDSCSKGGRQDQARDSSKGGFANGRKGGFLVALLIQADGLQGADIASDHGEDGDANATLDEDSEEGQLQQPRRRIFFGCREKQVAIESTGNVRQDHEGRGDAAEALRSKTWSARVLLELGWSPSWGR